MRSQIKSRAYRGWPCQISHAFFLWQVEDLVQTTAADGDDDEYDVLLNSDRPLTTLAAAATWVIETLAQQHVENAVSRAAELAKAALLPRLCWLCAALHRPGEPRSCLAALQECSHGCEARPKTLILRLSTSRRTTPRMPPSGTRRTLKVAV